MLQIDLVSRLIGNQYSGLLSRYNSDTGVVRGAIAYLRLHPFAPIGLADVAGGTGPLAGQILGDSGPVNYLLRGGVVELGAVYGGFWLFVRGTVRNKRVAIWLWGVTLAFELGFSSLLAIRLVVLIMLSAMCLGDVCAEDREAGATSSPYRFHAGRMRWPQKVAPYGSRSFLKSPDWTLWESTSYDSALLGYRLTDHGDAPA
jgi:hypothetical protein